jgi:hypothetical protein
VLRMAGVLSLLRPPCMPFVSKVKEMDNVDRPDANKTECIKLEFFLDPDDPA